MHHLARTVAATALAATTLGIVPGPAGATAPGAAAATASGPGTTRPSSTTSVAGTAGRPGCPSADATRPCPDPLRTRAARP